MSLTDRCVTHKKVLNPCLITLSLVWLIACASNDIPPERSTDPAWSPDGALIAYVCYKGGPVVDDDLLVDDASFGPAAAEICLMNNNGTHKRRLTHNRDFDLDPAWSPDGKAIAYIASDGLHVVDLQGGTPRRLFEGRWIIWDDPQWSPDGSRIAFAVCRSLESDEGSDIFVIDSDGNHLIRLDNPSKMTIDRPRWSPNGNQLAYRRSSNPDCGHVNMISENTYNLMIADMRNASLPVSVADGLTALRHFVWRDRATIIYNEYSEDSLFDLYSLDLDSGVQTLIKSKIGYFWALDRSSLAFYDRHGLLYVEDLSSGTTIPVSDKELEIYGMEWSPDGQRLLVYLSEEVPGRLNYAYTETIWIFAQDGKSASRLTPLMPSELNH